ncbi:MAG: site-specific DNA-methyltransferase [Bacteroidales bacterium]|nr:site-specific DNA-methyltransferase [Bacteroidales bacterium]
MKALLPQFAGRINVIYIDPPYNTGKEDWIYTDRFNSPLFKEWFGKVVGKEDLNKHEKWNCMMVPRLKLLRELLFESGIIIISCDDNEYHNLKSLLSEVFGEENFIGNVIWKNATDNNPTNIAVEHEYIIVYAYDKNKIPNEWKSPISDSKEELIKIGKELNAQFKDSKELQRTYSKWFRKNKRFLGKLDRYKYIDSKGVYTGSQSVHNPGKEGYRYDVIHPETKKACKQPLMGYRFPETTMQDLLDENKILFGNDETKIIELKVYAHEYVDKLSSVFELDGRLGAYDLRSLFGTVPFKNPKPVQLLTHILPFITDKNSIILDSFAGSGTTMHAVMELNKEDDGNRQCIMVQMTEATEKEPEKNICKDITRERVKRAIEKFEYGSGFKYYRVGIPLDAETMLAGELPTYNQFAKYVYYLCTGENLESEISINEESYFVGEHGNKAIYLAYKQDYETLTRLALNLPMAERIKQEYPTSKRIVYAPSCFLDEEYLTDNQIEFVGIPYNLFQRTEK